MVLYSNKSCCFWVCKFIRTKLQNLFNSEIFYWTLHWRRNIICICAGDGTNRPIIQGICWHNDPVLFYGWPSDPASHVVSHQRLENIVSCTFSSRICVCFVLQVSCWKYILINVIYYLQTCQASNIWHESLAFYLLFTHKFTHFCFSCSPYISLKLQQLQLRFTHFSFLNSAAMYL